MRDPAERQNRRKPGHSGHRGRKERSAGNDFRTNRFVFRRNAPDRVGDPAIDKGEAIIARFRIGAPGKTVVTESRVEQITGIIARERTPGCIGAAETGCEPDNQKPGRFRTKTGNRSIVPIRFLLAPRLAERHKPRAERAVPPWISLPHDRVMTPAASPGVQ